MKLEINVFLQNWLIAGPVFGDVSLTPCLWLRAISKAELIAVEPADGISGTLASSLS